MSSTDGGGTKARERGNQPYKSLTSEFFLLLVLRSIQNLNYWNSNSGTTQGHTVLTHIQMDFALMSANFADINIYFSILEVLNDIRNTHLVLCTDESWMEEQKCRYICTGKA